MQRGVVPRLPMSTNLHCWHAWSVRDSMNLAARVDSGDSRPASSVAPRCTVFLAGEGKACRMRCSMRLNSASRLQVLSFSFRLLWLQPQRLRFPLCTCEVLQAPCAKKFHPPKKYYDFPGAFLSHLGSNLMGLICNRRLGVMLRSHRRQVARSGADATGGVFGVLAQQGSEWPRLLHRSESRWRNSQKVA